MMTLDEIKNMQNLPLEEQAEMSKKIVMSLGEANMGQQLPLAQIVYKVIDDIIKSRQELINYNYTEQI